jgi:hypothetical protein
MNGEVIIRKQKIRISAPTEKLAFEFRQFANESLITDLTKMYEHLFYQSRASDEYLIIDSLKVDLGTLSTSEFRNHFFDLLEEKLTAELKKQFEEVPGSQVSKDAVGYDNDPVKSSERIVYTNESQQRILALLTFLKSGNFPWWYPKKTGNTPSQILSELDVSERGSFLLTLITNASVVSPVELTQIVTRLFIQLHESAVETFLTELSALFSEASVVSNIRTLIKQTQNLTQLFNITVRHYQEQAFIFLLLHRNETDFLKRFLQHLQQSLPETWDETKPKNAADGQEAKLPVSISKSQPIPVNEGLYISNAGLVILHPFLSTFFSSLNLLNEGNQFSSMETQTRAAVLLYYLQCGMMEYKEWEMPLNKTLCGMATNQIVPDNITLSPHEIEACHLLLNSVIEYWTALKGASIEALQTTFILREGKITFKEDHILIQVERTGVDILVDRLPWGIGTIKLPWLKEIMFIEW